MAGRENMSKTSEFIRNKRESLGITQAELAEKVGVFESEVRMWERGMLPDSKYLLKLADALQVEVDEILRGEEELAENVAEKTPEQDVQSSGQCFAQGLSPDLQEVHSDKPETPFGLPSDEAENGIKDTPTYAGENAQSEESAKPPLQEPLIEQRAESENSDDDDAISDYDFLIEEPLMRNGFTKQERILGYVAGAVFILIVLLNIISSIVGYVGRDRELTMENYKQYIELDSEPIGNFNIDTIEITVTFKEHVTDFKLSITVTLSAMLGSNDYVTDISFSKKDCEAGAVLSRQITFEYYEYSPFARIKVNSVSGGLD